jgi:DNA-binding MarR family transcriptional regulator
LANASKDEAMDRPRTMYLLNQATNGLMHKLAQALAEQKITPKQYTVLSIVKDKQPVSSSELSRRFYVTPQSMNEVIAGLEKAGFLSRTEDPKNRRILGIRLTKAGRELVLKCDAVLDRFEATAFGSISGAQHRDLRKVLRTLLDEVRTDRAAREWNPPRSSKRPSLVAGG